MLVTLATALSCVAPEGGSQEPALAPEVLSPVTAMIDWTSFEALAQMGFEAVTDKGAQRASEPGDGTAYATMGEGSDARRMQSCNFEGWTSTRRIKSSLFDLHSAALAHVSAVGAQVTGGLGSPVDAYALPSSLPEWHASSDWMSPPRHDLDSGGPNQLGFFVEYLSRGRTGVLLVVANRLVSDPDGATHWDARIGFGLGELEYAVQRDGQGREDGISSIPQGLKINQPSALSRQELIAILGALDDHPRLTGLRGPMIEGRDDGSPEDRPLGRVKVSQFVRWSLVVAALERVPEGEPH